MFKLVERDLLPVSWLHQASYCEYQFYLDKVKKVRVPATRAMIAGSRRHAELYQEFLATATPLEESLESYLDKLRAGKAPAMTFRELEIKSTRFKLTGRIDEIRLHPDKTIIIDNKPKSTAFPSDVNQVRAYALAFEDQFHWRAKIWPSIQNSHSLQFVYQEEFGQQERSEVTALVERMHALLDGETEFKASPEPAKCAACRFNFLCRYSKYKPVSYDGSW